MTTKPYQPNSEKWQSFPRDVQMRHIAAELTRATSAGARGQGELEQESLERSLILVDASLADPQWNDKKALYRLRDALAALYAKHLDPALSRYIAEVLLTTTS
ncbi:MAG: hypothetical protein Q8R39_01675 [bacterium]|nr:hypothetical protein [bacterium]MDZ4285112.1 hypothetical protein [Patescibacteria group bacterium]